MVRFNIVLNDRESLALAAFLRRVSFAVCRQHLVSDQETFDLVVVFEKFRSALESRGVADCSDAKAA